MAAVAQTPSPTSHNGSERAQVELLSVTQEYVSSSGRRVTALSDVSLAINRGEFVSIVGPTGCGKSTMLSAIAGLQRAAVGEVMIAGEPIREIPKEIGFVFQQDALLPWRTALQNVELPLRFRGAPRRQARKDAREWLQRVGLGDFESAYPHQLSGGMRKRTALAATLAYEPSILLMDEPFSALDVQTRVLMENDILALWQAFGHQTVVFVTHDLEEAIGLSDRVVVLSARPGRVRGDYRIDLPRPRNLLEVRFAPGFDDIYRTIWQDLEKEVRKAQPLAGGGPTTDAAAGLVDEEPQPS